MTLIQAAKLGLLGLLSDANFWFASALLAVTVFLGLKHVISDVGVSAIVGVIGTIYTYTAHRVDIAQLQNKPPSLPNERGSLQ